MAEPIVPINEQETDKIEPARTLVIDVPPVVATKKRPGLMRPLIAVVAIFVVLLVLFFVGDALARQYATGLVREKIVEALKLDPAAVVDVDLGGGSILVQAIAGSIDDLGVHVSEFSLGEISGRAEVTATKVPLDSSKPLGTMAIVVTVDEANVQKLSGFLSGIDLTSITLRDGFIRIGTDLNLFFVTVPAAVDLSPSAKDGGISFEPVTVLLGEQEISVTDLRAVPGISGLAGGLLGSRTVCVASYLPEALAVKDVEVVGSNLVVSINGDGAELGGPGFTTLGSCPSA